MEKYKLEITLKSDTLIGSGETGGAIIDSDIHFDEAGIPYIPAKRIKGLLKDSAEEVVDMLISAGIKITYNAGIIDKIFGSPGQKEPAYVYFSNLYIQDYKENFKYLKYFIKEYPEIIPREEVEKYFTTIRHQTAIEDSKAKNNSLRTIRVCNKNNKFYCEISIENNEEDYIELLSLACANLRSMGTKRNRGFGEIECILFGKINLNDHYLKNIEKKCTN
ncbi:MAG: hypothetical protein EHM58_00185 [Ignavibacteriae bacterium]|nr:MAG: hypothetical protein EHM58_00185 [Ignavibacteriota bacterium]